MNYMWITTGFSVGFVSSYFFEDTLHNSYFYDQNYNAFYTIVINANVPAFTTNPPSTTTIAVSSILTNVDALSGYVYTLSTQLINAKLSSYLNSSDNVITSYTQNPSAFVASTLTNALTGTSYSQALATQAPLLTSPSINFSFNEILNNYQNGTQIISALTNVLSIFQSNTNGLISGAQSIADFKAKVLRSTAQYANSIQQTQGQLAQYQGQNTFSYLASGVPGFSNVNNLLNNANSNFALRLTGLIPSTGLAPGSTAGVLFQSVFGGFVRQIMNPLDVFLLDATSLTSVAQGNVLSLPGTNLNFSGFSSPQAMMGAANQVMNLLSNMNGKMPTVPTIPIPAQSTNTQQIFETIAAYATQVLNINTGQTSPQQQAMTTLMGLMKNSAPTPLPYAPTYNAQNPYTGGSFTNTPGLSPIIGQSSDPTIQTPPNKSPDPTVQQQQNSQTAQQQQSNAPGTTSTPQRGSGVNIFPTLPSAPRGFTSDGSLGTYTADTLIPNPGDY